MLSTHSTASLQGRGHVLSFWTSCLMGWAHNPILLFSTSAAGTKYSVFSPLEAYCWGSLWSRNTATTDSPRLWNFTAFGDYIPVNCNLDLNTTNIVLAQVLGSTRCKVLLRLYSLLISFPYMQTDGRPEQQAWGPWCASGWSSQSTSTSWVLWSEWQAGNHSGRWQLILMEDLRQLGGCSKLQGTVSKCPQYSCQLVRKIISTLYLVLLILIRVDLTCCSRRTRGWCCSSSWGRCLLTLLTDVLEYKRCQREGADLLFSYSPHDSAHILWVAFP